MARSICKTVPYEGEPQLTLKFPVPIFHQTNQTAPKKTLEFLRLSQKKETKRHFVNSNWSTTTPNIMRYTSHPTNQKTKKKKTSSLKALRQRLYAHPAKLSTWRLPNFFGWGGRQSRICASVNFHSGYRRESLLKMKNCDPNHRRSEIKKEWSLNQSGDTSGFFLLGKCCSWLMMYIFFQRKMKNPTYIDLGSPCSNVCRMHVFESCQCKGWCHTKVLKGRYTLPQLCIYIYTVYTTSSTLYNLHRDCLPR